MPTDSTVEARAQAKMKATVPADTQIYNLDLSKHLISPSRADSLAPSPFSPASPSSSTESGTGQRMLRKKGEVNSSTFGFTNGEDFRPSRWDSKRWSRNSSFQERSGPEGGVCKCAAGLTADVAAVCCCPLSLIHLLVVAFIKLPSALISKTFARIKQKIALKRRRSVIHGKEDDSVPSSSYHSSRSISYETRDFQTWVPELGFGDQRLWRDYFDSPEIEVLSNKELGG